MALTRCPDCGREISTQAAACPGCGCPNNPPADGPQTPPIDPPGATIDAWLDRYAWRSVGVLIALLLVVAAIVNNWPDRQQTLSPEERERVERADAEWKKRAIAESNERLKARQDATPKPDSEWYKSKMRDLEEKRARRTVDGIIEDKRLSPTLTAEEKELMQSKAFRDYATERLRQKGQ